MYVFDSETETLYCLFIYLLETEREKERAAETQAEGEAGSMQGA